MRKSLLCVASVLAIGGAVAVAPTASAAPSGWFCSGYSPSGHMRSEFIAYGQAYSNFEAAKRFHADTGARTVSCDSSSY
ncbi:hypothetical protein P0W64_13000 [Tsukamurella sp. 8F]|uniref:hypothetical protein n=1 Tax=unclassified Tsukamurella TaxID=2633480 RepID=UPI0023B89F01|nr:MULTISPECIES: hypothetical protein [unclassified Tsukamurella]MDF0530486.1 hypothetical protein [Tsukamurella sp. 8J]MDF0587693.1 hypothetical protein [Tsukamurella sp. 8F]